VVRRVLETERKELTEGRKSRKLRREVLHNCTLNIVKVIK
jgi:hypothetical protein